jgi:hypothetical protein
LMNAIKVAIDSTIFFFCFRSDREDIRPINIRKLLDRLSSAPHIIPYVPISVIGESVIECLRGEKESSDHDLSELHELIDYWGTLDLSFLYPSPLVAEACFRLVEKYKKGDQIDYRLTDTDLVHLGYALAYNVDYFLTTDPKLRFYIPEKSKLRVVDQEAAKEIF